MGRFVFDAGQHRLVAVGFQKMAEVLPVIIEPAKILARQTKHPATVRIHPSQERRAAGRTGRRSTERVAEQNALLRETLHVRRLDRVAVGLDVTASVVRVKINDVGMPLHFESGLLGSMDQYLAISSFFFKFWMGHTRGCLSAPPRIAGSSRRSSWRRRRLLRR